MNFALVHASERGRRRIFAFKFVKGVPLMGAKLKIAGFVALGAVAGALTTMQLQAVARASYAPLPLEEMQQLAAVFGMIKTVWRQFVFN